VTAPVAAALAIQSLDLAADTPRPGSFGFINSADQFAILVAGERSSPSASRWCCPAPSRDGTATGS
jgi:hypothetical protein